MKIFKSFALIAISALTVLSGCSKDDDDNNVEGSQTIAALVSTNSNFTLLKTAVVRAGLVETLSASGTYTVFAPDNSAFQAAGLGSEQAINAIAVDQLRAIILYHVLGKRYSADAIPSGTTELGTASQANIYVTKKSNGVFVNGAAVKQADVMASNGIIHVINKVLMPPSGSILVTAQGNANLSFLAAAVAHANTGNTKVAEVLSGSGPFTVFAPTNAAFQAAGFANLGAIEAADPDVLASILTYHVVQGRIFSSDLTDSATPSTLNGGKLTISLNGGVKVKGSGNTTAANVVTADRVTINGVIHVIDQVLLPQVD